MNDWDFLVLGLVVLTVLLAVRAIYRRRRSGKGGIGCGADCSSCSGICRYARKE